ncbi:MBL fold metallo-hydrolase, partial [Candidatus Nomurabacteria bacterium]|nr:MBL fold metallo-hydrolase [Candidatus Nomurabacteria bacterium]
LKVGHHGSRTSSGENFIFAVSPTYAIISAGQNNKYGHPHQEVLDILNKFNIQILKTFEMGNIEFVTDGEVINSLN